MQDKVNIILITSKRGYKIALPLRIVFPQRIHIVNASQRIPKFIEYTNKLRKIKGKKLIICDYTGVVGLVQYLIARIYGCKYIVRLRGDLWAESKERIQASKSILTFIKENIRLKISILNLKCSDSIISVSNYLKERLINKKINPKIIKVVRTPVETNKYNIDETRDKNPKILLTVSNFNYWGKVRAFCDYLGIINQVIKEKTDWEFHIAGEGKYTPLLLKKLRRISNQNIIYLGYIDDITEIYSKASIFIYLSYLDALPSVVYEAMSFKLPVISNSNCGMKEQIKDNLNGYLIENNEQLKNSIIKLINDKLLRKELGFNGFQYIKDKNSFKSIGLKFKKIITGDLINE
jgi:glycosyltransferase involved in cell wall biosynthesis